MATSLLTWEAIHALAEAACKHFTLRWPVTFEPFTPRRSQSSRHTYGECEYDHCPTCRCAPVIRLRLRGRRGPLSRAALMAVLAHELAHLRYPNHRGMRHTHLTRAIAAWLLEYHAEPHTAHMLVIPAKRKSP